jgi:hypothetical protein
MKQTTQRHSSILSDLELVIAQQMQHNVLDQHLQFRILDNEEVTKHMDL